MSVEETIAGGKPAVEAAPDAAAVAAAAAAAGGDGKAKDGAASGADKGAVGDDKGGADKGKGADAGKAEEEGPWGKDWRDKLAKGDAKKLERLGRFASPDALLQSLEDTQKKVSEGLKPKGKPGDKAKPEDWVAYRKESGIPEAVDDYVKAIPMPDGRQVGDDDKPVLAYFSEKALARGVAPADMGVMVDAYYAMQEEQVAEVETSDANFRRESQKLLKEEYGGDFDGNIAAMRPYFDSTAEGLFDNLFGGRLADGSKIGDHPEIVRFFVAKAVAENPLATIVPSQGGAGVEAMETEIAGLEKRMRDDRVAWHKDTKAQERYRQLITARDKLKA